MSREAGLADVAQALGGEAAALVGDLMLQNARDLDAIQASLYRGMEAERDEWKERALRAEQQLVAIERRVLSLLYDPPEDVTVP